MAAPHSASSSSLSNDGQDGAWEGTPEWEGEDVPACRACVKPFKFTRRRHHCRGCGRVHCDDCTTKRFELPAEFKLKGKQRVCDDCYYLLVRQSVDSNPDQFPPRPDVAQLKAGILDFARATLQEPESSWAKKCETKQVNVWTCKLPGSSVHMVRTVCEVPCQLEKVWGVYTRKDLWRNWQPDMKECRTIERISDTEEFLYVLFDLPVLDNRDTVSYSCILEGTVADPSQPGARSLIGCSTSHPLCPEVKGVVRAHMKMSMTTFEAVSESLTRLTTILHVDIRGLVPPMIINQALTRSSGQITDMINFIVAHPS